MVTDARQEDHFMTNSSNLSYSAANPFIIALFPGQGSQHVGMGKDLYQQFSVARETFEEASEAIHIDLSKLCFDSSETELALTENTQPSLLVTSIACFRVVEREYGLKPMMVAGHSLGEYSALVASGSLSLTSATRWVRERGIAMQKAVPVGAGKMAAILGLEEHTVQLLCQKAAQVAAAKRDKNPDEKFQVPCICEPANYNAPGQVVIAGASDAIEEAIQLLRTDVDYKAGKAVPLQVSAPFHSSLMKPARDRMAKIFSEVEEHEKSQTPSCPYIPNRTARPSTEANLIFELLIDQIDHPVLWRQSMSLVLERPHLASIEFGPGKVLTGLMKRIAAQSSQKNNCVLNVVNDSTSIKGLKALFT